MTRRTKKCDTGATSFLSVDVEDATWARSLRTAKNGGSPFGLRSPQDKKDLTTHASSQANWLEAWSRRTGRDTLLAREFLEEKHIPYVLKRIPSNPGLSSAAHMMTCIATSIDADECDGAHVHGSLNDT